MRSLLLQCGLDGIDLGIEGMNFALAEIKRAIDNGAARNDQLTEHIGKLVEELRDVRQEIVVSREVLVRARP